MKFHDKQRDQKTNLTKKKKTTKIQAILDKTDKGAAQQKIEA